MNISKNLLQTLITTYFIGELIGEDDYGNKYYQKKILFGKNKKTPKRWVIYKGESTHIPANWFGWLHYTEEKFLQQKPLPKNAGIFNSAKTKQLHYNSWKADKGNTL